MPKRKPENDVMAEEYEQAQGQVSFGAIAARNGTTRGKVAGAVWRKRLRERMSAALGPLAPHMPVPVALELDNCLVVGDVHLPTTSLPWLERMLWVGLRKLPKPRWLIVAGDLVNFDAFSHYPVVIGPDTALDSETDAAEFFLGEALQVFERVVLIQGNHERRAPKATGGALRGRSAWRTLLGKYFGDDRVLHSDYGYLTITTSAREEWLVVHGDSYSVMPLKVARELASTHGKHVMSFHEHHLGQGWDKTGQRMVVNGGGLFGELPYALVDKTRAPAMQRGFVLMRDGVVTLYGEEPMTDWGELERAA